MRNVTIGDHLFGILPLLASRLNGAGGMVDGVEDPRAKSSAAAESEVRPSLLYSDLPLTR